MEVHAHTHPAHGGTGTKKWTHYLWEFLMLFLAVFCGFLAENKREHMLERQREKNFSIHLLADLRSDSAFFNGYIGKLTSVILKHEEFAKIMKSAEPVSNYHILKKFYPLFYLYRPNLISTTYSQMKSSGTLRYIHNQHLIYTLQSYYEEYQKKIFEYDQYNLQFYQENLVPFALDHFLATDTDPSGDSIIVADPVYFKRSKETDMRLLNIMEFYNQDLVITKTRGLEKTIPVLNKLIAELKDTYNLK